MSKKIKSPVRRDQDFEELDQELEAAMRALESVNERTVHVLERVDQGADLLADAEPPETPRGGDSVAAESDAPKPEATGGT
jgi:hypothetical protein